MGVRQRLQQIVFVQIKVNLDERHCDWMKNIDKISITGGVVLCIMHKNGVELARFVLER